MLGGIAQMGRANGQIDGPESSPFHDSPFYDVYACADGGFITLGALEPQFYALLLDKLGLTDVDPAGQYDKTTWPALKARFAALFASRPRAHWCDLLEGSDACFAPVLSIAEAAAHPHNVARGLYSAGADGAVQVAGAPRFLSFSTMKPEGERLLAAPTPSIGPSSHNRARSIQETPCLRQMRGTAENDSSPSTSASLRLLQ